MFSVWKNSCRFWERRRNGRETRCVSAAGGQTEICRRRRRRESCGLPSFCWEASSEGTVMEKSEVREAARLAGGRQIFTRWRCVPWARGSQERERELRPMRADCQERISDFRKKASGRRKTRFLPRSVRKEQRFWTAVPQSRKYSGSAGSCGVWVLPWREKRAGA